MKTFLNFKSSLILALMLLFSVSTHEAVAQTTSGTDFWVTFMPNYFNDPSYPLTVGLVATSHHDCTVTVTNPRTGWSTELEVPADGQGSVNLPLGEAYYEDDSDQALDNAFHVTATDEISLFASNFRNYSFDVGHVLPTEALGSEYVVQCYPSNSNGASDHMRAVFSIVAVDDNTTVTITPTCHTKGGHPANQAFTVTLDAGQCYQVQSEISGDFSGSWIRADDGKRVAVFAGDRGTVIPEYYPAVDAIFDQMPPVASWGKRFVVTGSLNKGSDRVRITALNDGCEVYNNGVLEVTLSARETYEFELSSFQSLAYLETTEPALVILYITGCVYSKGTQEATNGIKPDAIPDGRDDYVGDPAMVTIMPLEQALSNYATFPVYDQGQCRLFHLNVVTETDNVEGMTLDGVSIATAFSPVPNLPEYACARIELNVAPHCLRSDNGSFISHTYGLGDAESYAFVVGSKVMDLTSQITVNDVIASSQPRGFDVCEDEVVEFGLQVNFEASAVQWRFGDGGMASGFPVTHHFATAGHYEVACDLYTEQQGQNQLTATLTTTLHVHPNYYIDGYEIACESYEWNGQTYTESGVYEYHGESVDGCDSLYVLHLTVGRGMVSDTAATACGAFTWYGETYDASGWYYKQLQTVLGCDSVVFLNLTITQGPFEARLHGPEWIAAATDMMGGTYKYYVADSLHIAPNTLEWTCSNPGWVLYPQGDGYRCEVWASGIGQGKITAWTGAECDSVYRLNVTATWYDVPENETLKVKVYPNPTPSRVTVEAEHIVRIRVMDGLGQVLVDRPCEATDSVTLDLADLPQGIYTVEIRTATGKFVRKVVVAG